MKPFLDTFRFRHAALAVLCAFGLLLAGCGGSSSGGDDGGGGGSGGDVSAFNEDPAVIDDEDDAEAGAEAARESARQAVLNDETAVDPIGVEYVEIPLHKDVVDLADLHSLSALDPLAYTSSYEGPCGGSYTVTVDDTVVVYDNYCVGSDLSQYLVNGRFDFDYQGSNFSQYVMQYDYTLTYGDESYRYQGTRRCDSNGCSEQTEYVGTNGRRYRSQDVSVQYDGSGYSVSAVVYDGDRGYVRYEADNLVLCDSGIGFTSGTITVSDNSGAVVSVVFDGCTSYTVEYRGNSFQVTY